MPKYAKFLKDLLTNRKKMEEASKVILNENFSAVMLNKLPKKMGGPEKFQEFGYKLCIGRFGS